MVFPEALLARTGAVIDSNEFEESREIEAEVPEKFNVPPPRVSVAAALLVKVIPPSQTPVLVAVTVAEALVKTAVLVTPLRLLQGFDPVTAHPFVFVVQTTPALVLVIEAARMEKRDPDAARTAANARYLGRRYLNPGEGIHECCPKKWPRSRGS
jgi:hypothetical protein